VGKIARDGICVHTEVIGDFARAERI